MASTRASAAKMPKSQLSMRSKTSVSETTSVITRGSLNGTVGSRSCTMERTAGMSRLGSPAVRTRRTILARVSGRSLWRDLIHEPITLGQWRLVDVLAYVTGYADDPRPLCLLSAFVDTLRRWIETGGNKLLHKGVVHHDGRGLIVGVSREEESMRPRCSGMPITSK